MNSRSPTPDDLDFCRGASDMANAGKWATLFTPLPDDVASLARIYAEIPVPREVFNAVLNRAETV